MVEMSELLILDRPNELVERPIAIFQEPELIAEVPVNRAFDRRRAYPDCLAAQRRRHEAEHPTAVSPKRHGPAGSRIARGHRPAEKGAMLDLVLKRLFEKA